jgi:DNA-binding LacI/PurR family transcriptional regulator
MDAAVRLAGHLSTRGRSRLFGLFGPFAPHRLRHDAQRRAAAEAGLQFDSAVSGEADPFAAGLRLAREQLKAGLRADALVCATDQMAMGALRALAEAGTAVPGEVAVTGFDDIPAAAQINPALTTLRQPLDKMVAAAFERVVNPGKPAILAHQGELIIRETA